MPTSKFNHAGAYHCRMCQKLTRETGRGEADLQLCLLCLYQCDMDNALNDYGADSNKYKNSKAKYDAQKAKQS